MANCSITGFPMLSWASFKGSTSGVRSVGVCRTDVAIDAFRAMHKWIILTSASEGEYVVFLFPLSGEQNWGTKSSLDVYLLPFTRVAWCCSLLVKFGLQGFGFYHLCFLSHLTLTRTWPQITHGGKGTGWRNVPTLSHHDLSKWLFRLKVATRFKSLIYNRSRGSNLLP